MAAAQEIKCNVNTCKHHETADNHCKLHDITVGNSIEGQAHEKCETLCSSFDCE